MAVEFSLAPNNQLKIIEIIFYVLKWNIYKYNSYININILRENINRNK